MMASCSKSAPKLEFDLPVTTVNFTIDTTSFIGDTTIGTGTFIQNLKNTLALYNVKFSDIESIKCSREDLTILSPDSQNFNKFVNLAGYISIMGAGETKIALQNNITPGSSLQKLGGQNTNVFNILSAPEVSFRVSGFITDSVTVTDSVQAKFFFHVYTKIPV